MKKVSLTLTLLLAFAFTGIWAQGPNNTGTYYRNADNQKGETLKTAFFNIIKNVQVKSYGGLIDAYKKTDTRPDGYVRD